MNRDPREPLKEGWLLPSPSLTCNPGAAGAGDAPRGVDEGPCEEGLDCEAKPAREVTGVRAGLGLHTATSLFPASGITAAAAPGPWPEGPAPDGPAPAVDRGEPAPP